MVGLFFNEGSRLPCVSQVLWLKYLLLILYICSRVLSKESLYLPLTAEVRCLMAVDVLKNNPKSVCWNLTFLFLYIIELVLLYTSLLRKVKRIDCIYIHKFAENVIALALKLPGCKWDHLPNLYAHWFHLCLICYYALGVVYGCYQPICNIYNCQSKSQLL